MNVRKETEVAEINMNQYGIGTKIATPDGNVATVIEASGHDRVLQFGEEKQSVRVSWIVDAIRNGCTIVE